MTAPLVAEKSPWAGVRIVEDVEQLADGVGRGSWIDGTLAAVGGSLDGLGLVTDPAGALAQYGVAWLIEHVEPLSEALDRLAGDPGRIAAQTAGWRTVASGLTAEADSLRRAVGADVAQWDGSAATAYRARADDDGQAVRALGAAAGALAAMTEGAGALVGAVRLLVRDAVAAVVSRLIGYAVELLATAGLATPVVAGQVAILCASWAARISGWLRALISSLRRLAGEGERLGRLIQNLAARRRTASAPEPPERPHKPGAPERPPKLGAPEPPEPPGRPRKLGDPERFDPASLRGLTPDEVRELIPDDWAVRPSRAGGGIVYADPEHRGRQIRLMPGYPPGSRPDPGTWGPYAKISQDGVTTRVPLAGNETWDGADG